MNIAGKGSGQVNLNIAALPAGMCTYSFLIDGREAGSKKMVITKSFFMPVSVNTSSAVGIKAFTLPEMNNRLVVERINYI